MKDKYSADINKTVYRIANNQRNNINVFVEEKKYAEACDLAISVLSVVEQRKRPGQTEVSIYKIFSKIQSSIVDVFTEHNTCKKDSGLHCVLHFCHLTKLKFSLRFWKSSRTSWMASVLSYQ